MVIIFYRNKFEPAKNIVAYLCGNKSSKFIFYFKLITVTVRISLSID
jgi:hypothetical protein